MSALAALDPMVPPMVDLARTWPTEKLRAMYEEGTRLGERSTLWEDTMFALAVVLRERRAAELAVMA